MIPPHKQWEPMGSRPGAQHRTAVLLLGGLALVTAGSCVYDSDSRCGPHQVLNTDAEAMCVCDKDSVATADGCVPCGAHEVPGATACECAEGYARASANARCTETTPASGGQGSGGSNATGGTPASGGTTDGGTTGTGGASSSCAKDGDCADGYVCNTKVSPSVCRKRPEGLGKACTTPADCAGTEATFCDAFQTKACTVEGCSLDPDDCLPGYTCCDLSAVGIPGTLCALGACL
jgi:hypothetical protein